MMSTTKNIIAGFDAATFNVDISSKESILDLISEAMKEGEISMLIYAAGLSPSQSKK